MNTKKQSKLHIWLQYVIAILLFATFVATLASCNVTRNVTTRSEFYQRGDTSIMIQTKTTETYDGSIKR